MQAVSRWMLVFLAGLLPLAAAQAGGQGGGGGVAGASGQAVLRPVAAAPSPMAVQATMLGAAWAGPRVVAVGDHGIVLLSDDRGGHFRQARSVPVSSVLTSVSFVGDRQGWAVGHWGAILHTVDGGETWQTQRLATDEDRPLFAVHFFDERHGVAVGLWSLVLVTADGGSTWTPQPMAPPPGAKKADLNLLGLFADDQGVVYATAERGLVLRSQDQGHSWHYLNTGYKGSLWCGAVMADGALVVGGQRGTLLRSADGGRSWNPLPLQAGGSVTAVTPSGSQVWVTGLDGLVARSTDGGQHFTAMPRADGVSLTAVLADGAARPVMFSRRGVVSDPK